MNKIAFKIFVETQLNIAAQNIIDKGDKVDEISSGKIDFFIALKSALNDNLDKRELGLLDAVNDTLQHLQLVEKDKTFYRT